MNCLVARKANMAQIRFDSGTYKANIIQLCVYWKSLGEFHFYKVTRSGMRIGLARQVQSCWYDKGTINTDPV